ncbi:aminoglycoside adenylyltransferase domain-containing protein [Thalassobacillus devorans]|uniref:aminoglycoside adenylyltransferase domain-containing protein n=1 Tax=Thalassobacillus devorans TaxID=279813 RepID=UPI0004B71C37|nr:aminoglycoside adenylyltransferase domain-containing protein [Thalassobacillus devorans]
MNKVNGDSNKPDFHLNEIGKEIEALLGSKLVGLYLHGSLAMGGFNASNSDIDLLGVTKARLNNLEARYLTELFLTKSTRPFPIEITFMHEQQLVDWEHPSMFDFHYSEYWRDEFEQKKTGDTFVNVNWKDPDLAAHLTVTYHKGICLAGKPTHEVLPRVPEKDFVASIQNDYYDCLDNIVHDPVYCTLNLIRFYRYLKAGDIVSKLEGAKWGIRTLPEEFHTIIQSVLAIYQENDDSIVLEAGELFKIKAFLKGKIENLLEQNTRNSPRGMTDGAK